MPSLHLSGWMLWIQGRNRRLAPVPRSLRARESSFGPTTGEHGNEVDRLQMRARYGDDRFLDELLQATQRAKC